jgi:adenosine deaminase
MDILFTVCPTTTLHTTVWRNLADPDHAIARMIAAGLRVTVASDDPAMFGTDLAREYRLLAEQAGIGRSHLAAMAANGLSHSWRA